MHILRATDEPSPVTCCNAALPSDTDASAAGLPRFMQLSLHPSPPPSWPAKARELKPGSVANTRLRGRGVSLSKNRSPSCNAPVATSLHKRPLQAPKASQGLEHLPAGLGLLLCSVRGKPSISFPAMTRTMMCKHLLITRGCQLQLHRPAT
jgi:hypothetical protein